MNPKKTRKVLLVPLCVGLLFLLYFKLFLGPVQEDIRIADRELSALEESVASVRDLIGKREALTTEVSGLESRLREKKGDLPEEWDSHDVVSLLSEIDPGMLKKDSLIFPEPEEGEDFVRLPVRFCFSSGDQGFMDFLACLDAFSVRPSISDIQISAVSGRWEEEIRNSVAETEKMRYTLNVEMTLIFCAERK